MVSPQCLMIIIYYSFPPSFVTGSNSISWLYSDAADMLKPWLTTADAYNTFKR